MQRQQPYKNNRTGQWTRPTVHAPQEPYNQPPPPLPPVEISTTTKNKLQKFQFKPPRTTKTKRADTNDDTAQRATSRTEQQNQTAHDPAARERPPHQPTCPPEGRAEDSSTQDDTITMTGSSAAAAAREAGARASGSKHSQRGGQKNSSGRPSRPGGDNGSLSTSTSTSASASVSTSAPAKETTTTTTRVPTKPAADAMAIDNDKPATDKENENDPAAADNNEDLPRTQPDKIVPAASATPEFLSIHVKTPRARFVWQDLAGTPATPRIKESLGISPNAKLSWMPEQAQAVSPEALLLNHHQGQGQDANKTKNKRPRSSSPPSSPTKPRSKRVAENVKKFKEVMASAASANMALESSKYPTRRRNALTRHRTEVARSTTVRAGMATGASGMDIDAASAAAAGAAGAADNGVSPRTAAGFRRSASCNTIPTKRQRTCSVEPADAQGEQRDQLQLPNQRPRQQGALSRRATTPSRADEAPVDHGHSREPHTKASSPAIHRLSLAADDAVLPDTESIGKGTQPAAASESKAAADSMSDFGDDLFDDDVFDDDVLAELDASLAPAAEAPANASSSSSKSACAAGAGAGAGGGVADMEDMFGDDFGDDFDFEAAELAATQAIKSSATPWANSQGSSQHRRAIQRYLVTNVITSTYEEHGRSAAEKILVLRKDGDKAGSTRTVHLRGDWYNTSASVKAYVHVLGEFNAAGACVVDNDHNMLILHPDQLVSSTVVADSFECTRRAVLQDRVKATSEASAPLIYGTLLHEIFQESLMANRWDSLYLNGVIDRAIERHIEDLYTIRMEPNAAREYLLTKTTEMQAWAKQFVGSRPKAEAVAEGRDNEKINMCVSKLLDVEEHVWSPMYGLKGNIDATVQVTMHPLRRPRDSVTLTVPFELKTGKHASAKHRAQTVLYNLLLSDRYDLEIVYGVLYYMETSQTLRVPTVRTELRHMIMERNALACYIRERSVQLPPMLKKQHACGRCYAQTSCFVYHKLADGGDGASSGMDSKFDEVVGHLTATHRDFFLKWEDLLTKEEKEGHKLRRELWTMLSSEREKLGRCFGHVVIQAGSAQEEGGEGGGGGGGGGSSSKINRFRYTFLKENPGPGFSFLDSQLVVGEPIVVSDEEGHFALALGFVTAVHKGRIDVAVDRRLHNARVRQAGFDEQTNQVFAGIMEVGSTGKGEKVKSAPLVRYRLDKDEFSNGMATVRNNLVQVMAGHRVGLRETRQLVVDLVAPQFKAAPTQYLLDDNSEGGETLNIDQKRAIAKVMSAQDYALVLGMPGTGKTTTIAHIIRALVGQGKSVLLTSYTHTAVDNILLKLKNKDTDRPLPILRLGAPAKVHPEVRDFAILAGEAAASFEAIRHAWHDTPVVATTCLGINHALFSERTFDYCIVDEASQITLPICLGPIRMARTFVLVGDHNQLPPLVRDEAARAGGLDVSLFKLLSDTHPSSVVNLEHQYRMCEDIMTLSNRLIYNGRLKCGTEALRRRSLHVPDMAELYRHHHNGASLAARTTPGQAYSYCALGSPACWLRDLLQPATRVAFVNTDAIEGSREEAKGNRTVNPCEARLVAQLVAGLLTVGVPAADIGVMTPYRSQLAVLKHQLRGHSDIEMHTADRFQGRDKEVVVLSLVRSNEACHIGELLKDWRRINVAFTRAKTKLLVIGSRSTLQGGAGAGNDREESATATAPPDDAIIGEQMLARFVSLMEERNWIYNLPSDALESHLFDEDPTTQTGSLQQVIKTEHDDDTTTTNRPPLLPTNRQPPQQKTGRPGGKPSLLVASARSSNSSNSNNSNNNSSSNNTVGKENRQPLKRTGINSSMLLKGKPILQGILDDVMGGR